MPEKIIKDLNHKLMYPRFANRFQLAIKFANDYYFHGRVRISETFRTMKRQEELYAKGRTNKKSKVVTKAKAGQSLHNLGCAADLFILTHDGKYQEKLPEYKQLAGIMVQFGLKHIRAADYPHWEIPTRFDLPELYKKYRAEGMKHEDCILRIHSKLDKEYIIFNSFDWEDAQS